MTITPKASQFQESPLRTPHQLVAHKLHRANEEKIYHFLVEMERFFSVDGSTAVLRAGRTVGLFADIDGK